MTQARKFLYSRRMDLEGVSSDAWYGGLASLMIQDEPVQHAFDRFADRIIASVGREFVPVYRMADGEFEFITGELPRRPRRPGTILAAVDAALQAARKMARSIRFDTCWGETYYFWQRSAALRRLSASISLIADEGYLALYFVKRGDGWSEEYLDPTCEWFGRSGIELTSGNYIPFYAVYALLSGSRRQEILGGRHVLVVTHLTDERRSGIEKGLLDLGVRRVTFIPVSPTGALFETIDLSGCDRSIDIAVVAAGIGSAPILEQLRPLKVPSIDAGMWIDCLITPGRRRDRPYLHLT